MTPKAFDRFMVAIELGSSPKVGRLKDAEFRCLVTGVWALAAKSTPRGYLSVAGMPADEHDVARQAHCSVAVARTTLKRLRHELRMLELDAEVGLEYCHHWHDLNPDPKSDETAAERQRRRRERDRHGDVTRDSHAAVTEKVTAVTPTEVEVEVEQLQNNSNSTVEQSSTGGAQQVFDAWLISTGRTTRTVFDPKRRRIIARALKTYPVADLIDAVRGWQHSPHHRGENQTGTVYNDLELLLRDAQRIEKFRDLERGIGRSGGQVVPIGRKESPSEMWRAINPQAGESHA